jgi:2-polyprenyl-3-methyl-5-hydroxy-6-metoxy-1,4-benzoquinol methylase
MHDVLLPENVFGHTKKVKLFRSSIEKTRQEKMPKSLRILDIGCGSGYAVTRFLGKTGDDVLGVDLYAPNIHFATEHFRNEGMRFQCVDVESLSSNGEIFDVVVLADVLEHLNNPAGLLGVVSKLIEENGRVLVTVPNGRGPFEIESAISRIPLIGSILLKTVGFAVAFLNRFILKGLWTCSQEIYPHDLPYNADSGHLQFFSKSDMFQILKNAGFSVIQFQNLSFLAGPFTNTIFTPWKSFCKFNVRIADILPYWQASAWFFECRLTSGGE